MFGDVQFATTILLRHKNLGQNWGQPALLQFFGDVSQYGVIEFLEVRLLVAVANRVGAAAVEELIAPLS